MPLLSKQIWERNQKKEGWSLGKRRRNLLPPTKKWK